jgi:4'-phosphopantetheinyl transferase
VLSIACIAESPDVEGFIAAVATAQDRHDSDRFSRPVRRRQALVARALLRSVLARQTGCPAETWRLDRDPNGKPVAHTDGREPIEIAISHSHQLVTCAITDMGPIGIDVEYCVPDRSFAGIAMTAFGEREHHAVSTGGLETFYKIWSLREALAKASGVGFPLQCSRNDLFAGAPDEGTWSRPVGRERWTFGYKTIGGAYSFGVALRSASWGSAGAALNNAISSLAPEGGAPFDSRSSPLK